MNRNVKSLKLDEKKCQEFLVKMDSLQLHCQVCLGVEKAPLGESQKDNGGFRFENIPRKFLSQGGGGGAATAVVEVVLVLILIAMSCLAVYLGWRHYKTRCCLFTNIRL